VHEEKFPKMAKMTKNTLKSPKILPKNYTQTEKKISKNLKMIKKDI
jgi:hypothetical protein